MLIHSAAVPAGCKQGTTRGCCGGSKCSFESAAGYIVSVGVRGWPFRATKSRQNGPLPNFPGVSVSYVSRFHARVHGVHGAHAPGPGAPGAGLARPSRPWLADPSLCACRQLAYGDMAFDGWLPAPTADRWCPGESGAERDRTGHAPAPGPPRRDAPRVPTSAAARTVCVCVLGFSGRRRQTALLRFGR